MRGNEIRQGNKLVGVQSTREMPVQTAKLLQGAV